MATKQITDTFKRSVKRVLGEAFSDSIERFEPEKAVLYHRLNDGQTVPDKFSGFTSAPSQGAAGIDWNLVNQCFDQAQCIRLVNDERCYVTVPIRKPPQGEVAGVLYFDNPRSHPNFRKDELVSIEALGLRAGADVAMREKQLLSKVQRVLPTSDQTETWSGIRRAGLEAFKAGVNEMAASFLERAKNMAEEWGPCRELATSLNDYGEVLRATDNPRDALEQFERGMSILEQAGLERQPCAISLLNNLGGCNYALGNLAEAERLYRLGLDVMSEQKGENRATPAVMANLAVISKEMGDAATARVWLQQAVMSSTRLFGEEHPNTLKCRERLAELEA